MIAIKESNEFEQELGNIIGNFCSLYPSVKSNFYKELLNKLQYMIIFPKMYPILIQNPRYRKFRVKKYIILYEIKSNEIILTHIFHEKSNFFNNQD